MADRSEAERFAFALDRLLAGESTPTDDEELTSLLTVAAQLRREAAADEPDPQFLIRLRGELVDAARSPAPAAPTGIDGCGKRSVSSPSLRRVSGPTGQHWWALRVAAVLLVLGTATLLLNFWPRKEAILDGGLTRLPSLLEIASAYAQQTGEEARRVIGEATFKLATTLPKAQEQARVYRQLQDPIDEAGARELARRLGITAVANVADEPYGGIFVVTGEGGRLVVSKSFRSYFSFDGNAQDSDPMMAMPAPPSFAPPGTAVTPAPSFEEAIRVADEFLRARGLLPPEHIAETAHDAPVGLIPLNRQVTFIPTVEGRAVRGTGITVTVRQDGKITGIQSAYASLAPGDAYPIITAEEAYRRLEVGQPDLLEARQRSGSTASSFSSMATTAFPAGGQKEESPPYRVGETIELEGLLSAVAYEAKDGSRRYVATMLAGPKDSPTRVQFKLVGTAVEDLSRLDQQHVRVWGKVEQLSSQPSGGRLRVERFEKLHPDERLITLLGRIEIEGEGDGATLMLVADDGQRYTLESSSGAQFHQQYRGKRMIVEGRTTERRSEAGYPVIELAGMSGGSDVDQMRDLSGYQPRPRPQVIPERPPMITGEVAVKRAALEYYAVPAALLPYGPPSQDPFLLVQPVYGFSGSFDDGSGSFEAYVQAVRPEYVEGLR